MGKARRPATAALTKNGMKVSLVPLRFSNSSLAFARSAAILVMSISSTEYTCGETRLEATMCSPMRWRITLMGETS